VIAGSTDAMDDPEVTVALDRSAGGGLTVAGALDRLRRASPAAVLGALSAVALVVASDVVLALDGDAKVEHYQLVALVGLGLAAATCASLGALILAQERGHRLGIAFLAGGIGVSCWLFATAWTDVPASSGRPLLQWAAWLDNWIFVGLIVLVTWPLLLFPDGTLPSRRWRPIAALVAIATTAIALVGMLDPGRLENAKDYRNPLPVPAAWTWIGFLGVFGFGIPIAVVAGMVAVHRRGRLLAGPGARLAVWSTRVLALNFVLVLVLGADGPVYAATLTGSVTLFAVAATVLVLRYRTVEVDVVLRRAFAVAGVAGASAILFVAIFVVVEQLVGSSAGAVAGGLAVALLAVPLRTGVNRRVDRLLYGHRDTASAIAQLSGELNAADDDPAAALPGLARALAEALGASAVRIEPAQSVRLGAGGYGGALLEPVLERDLRHRGHELGRLLIGARASEERYASTDLELVDVLVQQIAPALDALRLATELQHSREEIVNAREEERRRIRRELHDGLGSALAGIALTLEAARNSGTPDELIDGARDQTQAAVADVRRIVRDLRPPALDDLGLVEALRAYAGKLSPLQVEFVVDADLQPLPAAVESALYRVACEAFTNVVRHARAHSCRLTLDTHAGHVVLRVEDDGAGFSPTAEPGVGLRSMRERAAELGGTVSFGRLEAGGSVVELRLTSAEGQ
jgi:two-component system, NarL family, sensor kinase